MKFFKPTSPGVRQMSVISYRDILTTSKPEKSLVRGRARKAGRNSAGRVTVPYKGGGHKRLFREIDFKYDKRDIPASILTVEYDPNRSGFIGLAQYADGEKRYILLPKDAKVGDKFIVSEKAPVFRGNRLPLRAIPVGTFIYNISLKPDGFATVARSGGSFAEMVAYDSGYAHIKMPSSEIRMIPGNSWATIGAVSNDENRLVSIGKAGRNRWLGIRPKVRASAKNPVDHPYGGGEGRQPRGRRRAITRTGKPVGKGQKSRHPKKYSNYLIVSRRRVGKKL